MKSKNYKYKKVIFEGGEKAYQPIIVAEVLNKKESIKLEVLLDTGADINLFSTEIAESIGLNIPKESPHTLRGIGGEIHGFVHDIGIELPGFYAYKTQAFFSPKMDSSMGILGQVGFFDHLKVTFNYSDRKIVIRRK